GFLFQQLSLSTGRLVPSVAAVSVANPVVSVMLGALVLQERLEKNPPWHAVVAVGALGLALVGSVVISSARASDDEGEVRAPEPSAAGPAQLADARPTPGRRRRERPAARRSPSAQSGRSSGSSRSATPATRPTPRWSVRASR